MIDIAVRARDSKGYNKGEITSAKPHPRGWGNKMVLPDYIRVTVSDADMDSIKPYISGVREEYTMLDKDTVLEIWSNCSAEKRQKIKEYFLARYPVLQNIDIASNISVLKSELLELGISLEKVKTILTEEIKDKFRDYLKHRKYKIRESVIDNYVSNEIGEATITLTQLQNVLELS